MRWDATDEAEYDSAAHNLWSFFGMTGAMRRPSTTVLGGPAGRRLGALPQDFQGWTP